MGQKQKRQRQKIAILGGGIAGLSTAYFLTEDRDWKEKFEDITVFQMGWRLGGKCATGRGPARRIEEHGIHLFGGGYYNALRMMWNCYEELREPGAGWPVSFEEAFTPHYKAVSLEGQPGTRRPHATTFPKSRRGPNQAEGMDTVGAWLFQIADIVLEALTSRLEVDTQSLVRLRRPILASTSPAFSDTDKLMQAVLPSGNAVSPVRAFRAVFKDSIHAKQPRSVGKTLRPAALAAIRQLSQAAEAWQAIDKAGWEAAFPGPSVVHQAASVKASLDQLRFMLSLLFGTWWDVLVRGRTFKDLDDKHYAAWLRSRGADNDALNCGLALAPIRILYQYPNGNPKRKKGDMGAGAYIQWSLRSFAYLTAPFWQFAHGTGESVVLPLYELLKRRGVKFEFFHKVTKLNVTPDGSSPPRIADVELEVQATPKDVPAGYQPLLDAKTPGGLPCWPAQPLFDQLAQGDDLKSKSPDTLESAWSDWNIGKTRTLKGRQGEATKKDGQDSFDKVVLAISIGAHEDLCKDLMRNKRWSKMVAKIPTVETHSLQLWLSEPSSRLLNTPGLRAAAPETLMGCGLSHPFDGFADFTPLLAQEGWPAGGSLAPRSLWYFSDVMAGSPAAPPIDKQNYPTDRAKQALAASRTFVNGPLLELFDPQEAGVPDTSNTNGHIFDDSLLVAPPGSQQPDSTDALAHQWVRANIQPSDRYVQAPVGSAKFRLKANNTGFSNLVVAGDWTYTGLNVGCVEAAVMSGHLAANAILGRKEGQGVIGYFP